MTTVNKLEFQNVDELKKAVFKEKIVGSLGAREIALVMTPKITLKGTQRKDGNPMVELLLFVDMSDLSWPGRLFPTIEHFVLTWQQSESAIYQATDYLYEMTLLEFLLDTQKRLISSEEFTSGHFPLVPVKGFG